MIPAKIALKPTQKIDVKLKKVKQFSIYNKAPNRKVNLIPKRRKQLGRIRLAIAFPTNKNTLQAKR